MDAIACGVEAKLVPFHYHLKTVIEGTSNTARQLGIPEDRIQQWTAAKVSNNWDYNENYNSASLKSVKSQGAHN